MFFSFSNLGVSGYLMQFVATNDSLLMTQHLKNHTLFHDTYLYRCHKRVPIPFPPVSPVIELAKYLLYASISLFMRKYGRKSLGLILLLLYRWWPFNLGCSLIYRGFTDHCLVFILQKECIYKWTGLDWSSMIWQMAEALSVHAWV